MTLDSVDSANLRQIAKELEHIGKTLDILAASVPSKTDAVRERGEQMEPTVYRALAPDVPIGAAIHGTALVGHECRMMGVTMHVRVEGRAPDTRAQHLYILVLQGPHSTYRLLYSLNLWRPPQLPALTDSTTGAEQDPPNSADRFAHWTPQSRESYREQMLNALESAAVLAEREDCIADVEAAFYGDTQITNRYDVMNYILTRIKRRGGAETPRIGVHDYNSLVECLRQNFYTVFSTVGPPTDPQNMIQLMAAEIQDLRRRCDLEHGS